MRVDNGSIKPNPVNPYNAATEKTVTARRSYQTRKRLSKRASGVQAWAGMDKAQMIGQWMNGGQGQANIKDQRHSSVPGKDSKIG